ncbi:MAG: TIGR02147 family protein [Bdellovibrionales bacterium]|nr:TIGR02147 family protein [Bdellovibrionales bacterium]
MEAIASKVVRLPLIKEYEDYRKYLSDFHHYKKQTVSGWSYRLFAQRAGIQSPNYLQLVMKGDRNLSESMALQVTKAMGLKANEKEYFIALVRVSNARSPEEEASANKLALRSLRKLMTSEMNLSQSYLLEEWYHLIVRELVALKDFEFSGEWVSQKLNQIITPEHALASLELLYKAGQIAKDDKGKWFVTNAVIDSGPEGFLPTLIAQYHEKALKGLSQVIGKIPAEQRELGLLTISLRKEKVSELKQKMRDFQDEIIGWLGDEGEPDAVVELGTYLVPMTKE